MSQVGKFFFSKLVLPAIAVQASETEVEERDNAGLGHHSSPKPQLTAQLLSPANKGNLDLNTHPEVAPAFVSRRNVTARATSAYAAGDDPLLRDLLAFRAWQQQQQGAGQYAPMFPYQPVQYRTGHQGDTPSNLGNASRRATSRGNSNARASSDGGATQPQQPNIIIVNAANTEYRPSNLAATHEPTSLHMDDPDQRVKATTLKELRDEQRGVKTADGYPSAIEEERSLQLDVNDPDGSKDAAAADAAEQAAAADSGTQVEEVKIVQTVVDGKKVDRMVTTTTTYSDEELYQAATQFYHRLLAELLGTWAITFFIAGFVIESSLGHINQVGVAIGGGLVFVFLIYSLGQVSGAHFNPIVTFAFVLRGMFPFTWLPFYWIVQFVGGILAAAMLLGFYGSTIGDAGATIVPNAYSQQAAFFMETVLSFVLVFTILSMASRSKIVGPHAALAIGAVIALNIMLAGSYSGASMNPWRSVCISIVFPVTFYSIWVYFAGPFFGSFLAVLAVFLLAGKPRNDELTAGIGASIAVAIGNSISRDTEGDKE